MYTVQWVFFDGVKFRIICPDELVWWLIGAGVLLTVLAVTVGLLPVSPQTILYIVLEYYCGSCVLCIVCRLLCCCTNAVSSITGGCKRL